jgi:hypothetical protein
METTFIYALADPRDGALRYVGKSNAPKVRYRRHVTEVNTTHRVCWIKGLRLLGLRPTLIILQEVPRETWEEFERAWIQRLKTEGCALTNLTDGGGHCELGPEARAKMRAAKVGKPPHNKGKQTSIEARQKQSESAKRRWERMTAEEKQQGVAHLRGIPQKGRPGHPQTPATRAKISAAGIGRRHSEETLRKLSAASRGRPHKATGPCSPERREKISRTLRALSDEQVTEIRLLLAEGRLTGKEIAARVGVAPQKISTIKNGKTYRDYRAPH